MSIQDSVIAHKISNFIDTIRQRSLDFQDKTLSQRNGIQKRRTLAQEKIKNKISKSSEKHKIEIEKLKTKGQNEIKKMKLKGQEEIDQLKEEVDSNLRDYKEFLAEIDNLKTDMLNTYDHVPKVMLLTIHRHAKEIIQQRWKAPKYEKTAHDRKLIDFLKVVYEDISLMDSMENNGKLLPEKSILYIKENNG